MTLANRKKQNVMYELKGWKLVLNILCVYVEDPPSHKIKNLIAIWKMYFHLLVNKIVFTQYHIFFVILLKMSYIFLLSIVFVKHLLMIISYSNSLLVSFGIHNIIQMKIFLFPVECYSIWSRLLISSMPFNNLFGVGIHNILIAHLLWLWFLCRTREIYTRNCTRLNWFNHVGEGNYFKIAQCLVLKLLC